MEISLSLQKDSIRGRGSGVGGIGRRYRKVLFVNTYMNEHIYIRKSCYCCAFVPQDMGQRYEFSVEGNLNLCVNLNTN